MNILFTLLIPLNSIPDKSIEVNEEQSENISEKSTFSKLIQFNDKFLGNKKLFKLIHPENILLNLPTLQKLKLDKSTEIKYLQS